MSPVLTAVLILLIPAGALPVITAWFLRKYRNLDSQALRDRWHVAVVMALLGVITTFLAANRLFAWGIGGEILVLPFGIALLLIDLVSGKWLIDYWRGAFNGHRRGREETALEREDREVGDERRKRQEQNRLRDQS